MGREEEATQLGLETRSSTSSSKKGSRKRARKSEPKQRSAAPQAGKRYQKSTRLEGELQKTAKNKRRSEFSIGGKASSGQFLWATGEKKIQLA